MTFETKRTRAQTKQRVRNNWGAWRLVFSDIGNFTHDYVFNHMTPREINEANIALDFALEEIKRANKKK